jgi:hypothetical protein
MRAAAPWQFFMPRGFGFDFRLVEVGLRDGERIKSLRSRAEEQRLAARDLLPSTLFGAVRFLVCQRVEIAR